MLRRNIAAFLVRTACKLMAKEGDLTIVLSREHMFGRKGYLYWSSPEENQELRRGTNPRYALNSLSRKIWIPR